MRVYWRLALAGIVAVASVCSAPAQAREQIRIAGSSTVYPFIATAAEQFGELYPFKTPIVESIGTGGGFKLFCAGTSLSTPDFANASRPITDEERELCRKNGVDQITEMAIGFDGIVLANALNAPQFNLTREQIFLALAKQVPKDGKLVDNFYVRWSDIDSKLPNLEIEVYGPPPTSGTRDAFVEILMEKACKKFPEFEGAIPDKKARTKACHLMREDQRFIDATENDNIIVQKLVGNPDALGIFGYSFLEENASQVKGSLIDNVAPTFENIANASYNVSRSLYVYAKNYHIGKVPGMQEFIQEMTSEDAMGPEGYMAAKGLIPLPEVERKKLRESLKALVLAKQEANR